MTMTRQEILEKSTYNEQHGSFELQEFSPLLSQPVPLWIYADTPNKLKTITGHIAERINNFFNIPASNLTYIKEQIYNHFTRCAQHTGVDTEFQSADDTFRAATLHYVYFDDYSADYDVMHYVLVFRVPWKSGQCLAMEFVNGQVREVY